RHRETAATHPLAWPTPGRVSRFQRPGGASCRAARESRPGGSGEPPQGKLSSSRHLAFLGWFRLLLDDLERHNAAHGVTQTNLEGPFLRPLLGLLVLADLHQQFVAALLKRAETDVLVHAHAVVVLLAGEDRFAVEEDFHRVDAAGPHLHRLP